MWQQTWGGGLDMTVQELIESLNKVEDKTLPVCYYTFHGEYEDIYGVEEHKNIYENFLRLLFEKDFEYELAKCKL